MIPGARAWAMVSGEDDASRPRVLFNMFSGRMPVLNMFYVGANPEPITNEPEYWAYFRPRPADDPAPREQAHWQQVKQLWQLRMAHPELKSGGLDFTRCAATTPPYLSSSARRRTGRRGGSTSASAGRPRDMLDWAAAGIVPPAGELLPCDLLRNNALPATSALGLGQGYRVTIPARDGVVVKL